ncbi:MAG: hypothetical protein IKY94_06750 [Lachnospiraceae bacterium]|nr:hypothetical protein [Lachnospiraceae bacterium]
MKFPFFASFVIFIFVLQHNIRKGKKSSEQAESEFWKRESSANDVRRQSLEDLAYITFNAEPFFPVNLLDAANCPEFLSNNQEVKEILSRFLFLEQQKIVNLTQYTNTDLKYKYGVANLPTLTEYDSNYNELITLLHSYGTILEKEGYETQALSVLEYAISVGSDISSTYTLCAKIYENNQQWEKIEWLKNEAEIISTSRKDSIVRKLQEFGPCNG